MAFVICIIIERDLFFSVVISIGALFFSRYLLKNNIKENTKKSKFSKGLIYIEQIIYEDKIIEKVYWEKNIENTSEYYYKNVKMLKEDKNNFYLYLNDNSALIVNKSKLENIDQFEKILKANNLID